MDQSSNCESRYTVKRGDSFYLIAHRTGVLLRDLLEANPGIPPSRLMVGDVLCIPYAGDVQTPAQEQGSCDQGNDASACPANRRAVVQNDQTAADLMVQYGLSYHTLQTANPDTDLENIKGGDVLCVPRQNTPCSLPTAVTMGENDTLESVAAAYHVSVGALLRANPCLAPADFKAGAVIRLPE